MKRLRIGPAILTVLVSAGLLFAVLAVVSIAAEVFGG